MINLGRENAKEAKNISYSQFCMAAINENVLINKDKITRAFNLFDQDESGGISFKELKFIMNFDSGMTDDEIREILKLANVDEEDKHGDDVSEEEFQELMWKLQNM